MAGLISLLDLHEKVMGELASALAEEQSCIIDMDIERLTENGGRKDAILTRLMNVREECRTMMQQAGCEIGLNVIPSLSTLIAASAATDQEKLKPLQQRLMWLSTTLERQHNMNRRMLENSIGVIKSSMALFGRMLGGCDTYGAQGHITSGRASGSILRQEI